MAGMGTDSDGDRDRDGDEKPTDADGLFAKLKGWIQTDYEKQAPWRKQAREDFGFVSGDQLNEDDKAILNGLNRPIVIFNRIEPIVDSVSGQEVSNRQEVQYIPRTQGAVQVNETLTAAAKWFRDQCEAEDEESDAFRDTVVCGMGWTETRLDYEDDPDGAPVIERADPLEMVWDSSARKRNLGDKRRVFHIKRDIPIDEARALCPGADFEDADYNANWLDGGAADRNSDEPHENDGRFYNKGEGDGQGAKADKTVTMIRAQWWEREPVYRVLDPRDQTGNNILTLDKDEFAALEKHTKAAGIKLRVNRATKKVYKQAYIGAVLLEVGDAPWPDGFSFNCITAKRDRNKNQFYGLVKAMKDPARWSNKWMSQTLHIMNSSAKGGIAVERGGFFEDDEQGEESWAQSDQVTYLKAGALGSGNQPAKMMPKPVAPFPQNSFELMQLAVTAHRDVSGVNVEILGMQNSAGQAASLDLQRKQSAMTILQPLFDSLRRYRKEQGKLLLYLIEHYLSDGRLIKIMGGPNGDMAQYVPLVKEQGAEENGRGGCYDVIVDESPTSPNQKEATWAILQSILPVIGKMIPPATWLALTKYSPLPTAAQKDISDSLQQAQQNQQPDPEAAKAAAALQAQNAKAQADIENHGKLTDAKIAAMRAEAQAKQELELAKAQHEALHNMLTTPAPTGPDGMPAPHPGAEAASLVVSLIAEMRRDMGQLAAAFNAPKQFVRDPQSGEITGIVPMQQPNSAG